MTETEKKDELRPSLLESRQKRRVEEAVSLLAYAILPVEGRLKDCKVNEALENYVPTASSTSRDSIIAPSSITTPQQQPSRSFWIDIKIPSSDDLSVLVRHETRLFDALPPFLKRHVLEPSQFQTPQTLVLPQSALTVLRVLPSDGAGLANYSLRHAAAICLKGLLITITTTRPAGQNIDERAYYRQQSTVHLNLFQSLDMSRHLWDGEELPEASTTGALSAWLYMHVMRVSLVLSRLRTQILDLCGKMDQTPNAVDLTEIVLLKDSLLQILAVAEEQDEVLQGLHKGQSNALDFSSAVLKSQMKAMLATSGATERMARRLDKRLAYVRSMYESLRQDRINQRLAVLTILSAIFLPLSLMAGIWGMNFVNIPELERENGYYYALATMAVVALTLLLVFWRLGWFAS